MSTAFSIARCGAWLVIGLAACGGGGGGGDGGGDDGVADPDAASSADAPVTAIDAPVSTGCQPLHLTADEACAITRTGRVAACSVGADGVPSQTGSLQVHRPDGSVGYLCADRWTADNGYFISTDRLHLVASADMCCGAAGPPPEAAEVDPLFGTLHGPTHVKPQEMTTRPGGDLRQNPFAIVVSSPDAASLYRNGMVAWHAWAGDGQPHAAPDGTGMYWFPANLAINYVVIPTTTGAPLLVIAPEPSMDPRYDTPLGHPTLGACPDHGGAPMAYIGGTIFGTTVTNASGRYGHEPTVTAAALDNVAALFDCYGLGITATQYDPTN